MEKGALLGTWKSGGHCAPLPPGSAASVFSYIQFTLQGHRSGIYVVGRMGTNRMKKVIMQSRARQMLLQYNNWYWVLFRHNQLTELYPPLSHDLSHNMWPPI